MISLQEQMESKLKKVGLPYKIIKVYGHRITIETISESTARKWIHILSPNVAKYKGLVKSKVRLKKNRNTVLKPSSMTVWRAYFTI